MKCGCFWVKLQPPEFSQRSSFTSGGQKKITWRWCWYLVLAIEGAISSRDWGVRGERSERPPKLGKATMGGHSGHRKIVRWPRPQIWGLLRDDAPAIDQQVTTRNIFSWAAARQACSSHHQIVIWQTQPIYKYWDGNAVYPALSILRSWTGLFL